MHNVHQKSSSARNWWISLLPELTVLKSEPVKTKVSEVGGGKLRFTIWDQVYKSMTCKILLCFCILVKQCDFCWFDSLRSVE